MRRCRRAVSRSANCCAGPGCRRCLRYATVTATASRSLSRPPAKPTGHDSLPAAARLLPRATCDGVLHRSRWCGGVEPVVPERPVRPKPGVELDQRRCVDGVDTTLRLWRNPHEACLAQNSQVLGHGGLAGMQNVDELA